MFQKVGVNELILKKYVQRQLQLENPTQLRKRTPIRRGITQRFTHLRRLYANTLLITRSAA